MKLQAAALALLRCAGAAIAQEEKPAAEEDGLLTMRPGPGGLICNPRGILHAMRAGHAPFLALWFLPVD